MKLAVKVVPGASRTRIAGWLGTTLKITVSAPAERGKANRAVAELLKDALGVAVHLVDGRHSPWKIFEVTTLSEEEVRRRIGGSQRPR